MGTELTHILRTAAETGDILRIKYHGGSQPGTVREISPISVTPTETKARDIATGIIKTFLLSKMEIAPPGQQDQLYDPNAAPQIIEEVQTIEQALAPYKDGLVSMGWHVQLSSDAITLHRFFKNGKPRKLPDISLTFSQFVTESAYDPDTDEVIEDNRLSTRPYRLTWPGLTPARTFAKLSSALPVFIQQAGLFAQDNAP